MPNTYTLAIFLPPPDTQYNKLTASKHPKQVACVAAPYTLLRQAVGANDSALSQADNASENTYKKTHKQLPCSNKLGVSPDKKTSKIAVFLSGVGVFQGSLRSVPSAPASPPYTHLTQKKLFLRGRSPEETV